MFELTYSAVWYGHQCYLTFVDEQLDWYQAATRFVFLLHHTQTTHIARPPTEPGELALRMHK